MGNEPELIPLRNAANLADVKFSPELIKKINWRFDILDRDEAAFVIVFAEELPEEIKNRATELGFVTYVAKSIDDLDPRLYSTEMDNFGQKGLIGKILIHTQGHSKRTKELNGLTGSDAFKSFTPWRTLVVLPNSLLDQLASVNRNLLEQLLVESTQYASTFE